MTRMLMRLGVAALVAGPVMAQTPPAPPAPLAPLAPPAPLARAPGGAQIFRDEGRGPGGAPRMFGTVSEEGRAVLREALRASTPEERAAIRAARDRVSALIAAEKLDVAALRQAMAEERRLVDAAHARRQAALLAAVQKLSPADRRAFAEDAGKGRRQAEERAAQWRDWAEAHRQRMRDMPNPPPPPPPAPRGGW